MPVLAMEDVRLAVKPDVLRLLNKVNRLLSARGIPAYLVGGCVRDWLLGRDTTDIDIAVGADALETAQDIAVALGGTAIPLDTENGVSRVVITGEAFHLDLSTLATDITVDMARRDFTINAIALPLNEIIKTPVDAADIIEPFEGRQDLRRRILRAVDSGIFTADAIRLFRAVRIAAELGLNIEPGTETIIHRDARLITTVAGERVREELLRLLALPGAGPRLIYLDDLRLLTALIPELEPARGTDQPRLHVWDVLDHSLQTVTAVEFLFRQGTWDYVSGNILAAVPWPERLDRHFEQEVSHGSTRAVLLKLAALLHDIAKPEKKTTDADGRTRFLGHAQKGAATVASILNRLRFSRREIEHVELLVRHHLRPTQISQEGMPTRRAVYRYFHDTGEIGIDLLFLSLADHLAARGATLDRKQWQEHTRLTGFLLNSYFAEESAPKVTGLIDGHDLMKTFRLGPGPKIGELLEAVREAQAAGELTDKPEALNYVQHLLADDDTPETN